jgi:hypothetical protein
VILTKEKLLGYLHHRDSGQFTWKVTRNHKARAGDFAGTLHPPTPAPTIPGTGCSKPPSESNNSGLLVWSRFVLIGSVRPYGNS